MSAIDYRNPNLTARATPVASSGRAWGNVFIAPFMWGVPVIFLWIVCSVVAMLLLPYLSYLAPLVGFCLALWVVTTCRAVVKARRRRNGDVVVGYVEAAVRLNLPLVDFLVAAEHSETGRRAQQIRMVRQMLASGATLTAALQAAEDVTPETVGHVAASEPMGQAAGALQHLMEEQERKEIDRPRQQERAYYFFYTNFLMVAVATITMFMLIFVVPKFRDIFRDFRMPLPKETERLIAISSFIAEDYGWVPIVLFVLVGGLGVFVSMTLMMHDMLLRRMGLPRLQPVMDWWLWRLPLVRGVERDRGMAEACELFARSARAGVPLATAATRALALPVNAGFRYRLGQFRDRLLKGDTPAAAALGANLPALFSGLLVSTRQESVADMFAFLARHYREKFSRTLATLYSGLEPVLVLCYGSVVAYVILALMLPLIKLNQGMMKTVEGVL